MAKPIEMREIEPGVFVARSVARARGRTRLFWYWAENAAIIVALVCLDFAARGQNSGGAVILRGVQAWLA